MSDELMQQVTQQAPSIGAGGLGGGIVALLAAFRMFATPKDVDLAKEQIRAEMAEKYAHKDELTKLGDDITYIRQRIDQIADRK